MLGRSRRRLKRRGLKRRGLEVQGEAQIADACQSYLTGSYRQFLEEQSQPVPAWAWINQLAHGDRSSIEVLAAGPDDGTPSALVASIARMLLQVADRRGGSLATLQQRLVPLEGRLASVPAGDVPADEDDLARALVAVLVSW